MNNFYKISEKTFSRLVLVVAALDFLVLLALLVIGTWCTWHPGSNSEGIEDQVLTTWALWGLVPASICSAALVLYGSDRKSGS